MREALEQGDEVTALARNPSAVAPEDYRPRVLEGNALDASDVLTAVAGQDAVLSALGTRSSGRRPFSRRVRTTLSARWTNTGCAAWSA
jgi:putative NADH-flavin reductase